MPHISQANAMRAIWPEVRDDLDIDFIDPTSTIEDILATIAGHELLITEALHGAIVADTFRVPWICVKSGEAILDFKWQDWTASLDMPYAPVHIPAFWSADANPRGYGSRIRQKAKKMLLRRSLKKMCKSESYQLSDDRILRSKRARLLDDLASLKG
jgi:succinoglycan biosynthesis protein ExoV